jgi:hypothetical protein
MRDEELNAAIDEVARQMTDLAPDGGAGFRRRVIARIEAGDAPRRSWRAGFVLSPIAVAMAIVIAAMFVRRPGPLGPGGPAGPKEPTLQTGTEPGPQRPDRPTPPPTAARTVRRPGPVGPSVPIGPGVQAPNGAAPAIAVLNLSPLTVDSIAVSPIETDSMELQKLDVIAPIGVTPLASPSEGDRP